MNLKFYLITKYKNYNNLKDIKKIIKLNVYKKIMTSYNLTIKPTSGKIRYSKIILDKIN